jgi:hypothetical protein
MTEFYKKYRKALGENTEFAELLNIIASNEDSEMAAVAVWMWIENSANWLTNCVSCGSMMDKNYEMFVRLDQIKRIVNGEIIQERTVDD